MPGTTEALEWRGLTVVSNDGDKLGTIEEIYLDNDSGKPEWALVTTGMFGTTQSFVPLRDASASEEGVTVPFDKSTVKDAPKMDPDGRLSESEEAELYRHYGFEYAGGDSAADETGGPDIPAPSPAEVILSGQRTTARTSTYRQSRLVDLDSLWTPPLLVRPRSCRCICRCTLKLTME